MLKSGQNLVEKKEKSQGNQSLTQSPRVKSGGRVSPKTRLVIFGRMKTWRREPPDLPAFSLVRWEQHRLFFWCFPSKL